MIKRLLTWFKLYRTRSRSRGGRCKFYDNCQWVRKDGFTCLHEDEAAGGNGGKPYCGKYNVNEILEKNR